MSVLCVNVVGSVSPSSFHNEASSSGANCGECVSHKAAPLSASLRRNTTKLLFRKPLVRSVRRSVNSLPRLQVGARQAEPSQALRSVPVQVAHELINAGHHCLDVRTQEEFAAGHVEGSVNIPYLVKAGPGMSKNLKFLEEVAKEFDMDDEIIVGCQSGRRSMMATAELRAANFTGVTDMGGGYSAWKESGLPVKHPGQA